MYQLKDIQSWKLWIGSLGRTIQTEPIELNDKNQWKSGNYQQLIRFLESKHSFKEETQKGNMSIQCKAPDKIIPNCYFPVQFYYLYTLLLILVMNLVK